MALPTNISTGLVTGQFIVGVADGADADFEPDTIPAAGTVTFTPSVAYLPDPTAAPNPVTVLSKPFVTILDGEGYLCTPFPPNPKVAGNRGIRLVATDDPDISVTGWTWNVTYALTDAQGKALPVPAHSMALPSGGTVDLTTVMKVPASAGIGLPQAEALAAAAASAALAAEASAEEAEAQATAASASAAGAINDAATKYLPLTTATSTYLKKADATATYLPTATAATTYAGKAIEKRTIDFDYTVTSPVFHDTLNLADATVMQCLVINETTNEIFATQLLSGDSESFVLSRLTINGTLIDSMRLTGGGHGTTFGIENVGADVYIWSAYNQASGTATDLVRFKYVPGAIYTTASAELVKYNKFTTDYMTPITDQKNGTIAFRSTVGETHTVKLRNLADVKAGTNTVLATVTIPADLSYIQGATIDGNNLYWYTGDTNSATYPNELARINMTTGAVEKRVTVDFGKAPAGGYEGSFREPEGVYLYTDPKTGAKSLFAGVVTGATSRRIQKVYAYHSLGNEARFIGNRGQKAQAHKLTENDGRSKRPPAVATLAEIKEPGSYYMTQAESLAFTDHPLPNVAGWFLEVGAQDYSGGTWQLLRRNTTDPANIRIFHRQIQSGGNTGWALLYSGKPSTSTIPAGTTVLNTVKTAGTYYMSTAESSTFTDHPAPGVGGWFLDVSPTAPGGELYQHLRRNTSTDVNVRVYYRQLNSAGVGTTWKLIVTG